VVPDARIAALLSAHAEPAEACDALVAEANDAGGPDNVTALVVHIDAA
jgi:protein phosphatase